MHSSTERGRIRDITFIINVAVLLGSSSGAIILFYLFGATSLMLPILFIILLSALWLRTDQEMTVSLPYWQGERLVKTTQIVIFTAVAISFFLLATRSETYSRPLAIFPIYGLIGAMVVMQILSRADSRLIMFNTLLMSTSIIWTEFLVYPSVFGIDPLFHDGISVMVSNMGAIPVSSYSNMPFFHILMGSSLLVTALGYKALVFPLVVFTGTFLYLVVRKLHQRYISDRSVRELSQLVLFGSSPLLLSLLLVIPNYFVYSLSLLCVILFFNLSRNRINVLLLGILFVVILGYHATAAVFTLATVFALAILEFDGNKSSWRVIILIMALVAALVAVWTATGLMGSLINRILNGVSFAFESQTDLHHVVPLWETWMNSMPVYLFFCLSYLGLLYFFKNKGKHRSLSILVAILMGLTLVGTLNIDAARMLVYVAFFASVAIGVSLVFIVRKAPKKFTPVALTALVFVLVVSSSMIPIVNYDNREPFPNIAISYALTESEMTAGGFSGDNNYNKIYTDTLYQYASQYLYGSFSRNTDYNLDSIEAGTYVVIRKYITENRAYVNETATSALAGLYPTMYGDGTMAVYDNGYVAHYLRV